MKPVNYYPSLIQRITFARQHSIDVLQLELLIKETELALADAPDPAGLCETLSVLKQTHANAGSGRIVLP